ncbi:MAG: hypothetical protein HFH75_00535 [Lachnospiraceae bacterium]|jgi:hypothetical protein|nr:hypothetical protein [Lachnospiraceae bacterium]MCI8966061.1 hypothetical protein [Lachnospiraceae bacterium]
MDPATAYFLKKYYPHVIKWWLVVYNPETVRIWPSKAEKDAALRLEAIEAKKEAENKKSQPALEDSGSGLKQGTALDDSAYNATTGSYSGLYGQKPVDENTQAALDAILSASNNQNSVDSLLAGGTSSGEIVTLPPEQDEIVREANEIYERLLREAAEDEARKQAEIDEMRRQAELQFG